MGWGGVGGRQHVLASVPDLGSRPCPHPHRLAELAPQYYLSNLPPSESRDVLMELREQLAAEAATPEAPAPAQEGAASTLQEDDDGDQDVCTLQ